LPSKDLFVIDIVQSKCLKSGEIKGKKLENWQATYCK
jgi:hypothetical protein